MGSMVVRNIPDEIFKSFKERAKADGKSVEQLAREAIAEKAILTEEKDASKEEAWARIDAIRAQTKPIDLETWNRIWDEARAERDGTPYIAETFDGR